jgi:hypothetical protein
LVDRAKRGKISVKMTALLKSKINLEMTEKFVSASAQ